MSFETLAAALMGFAAYSSGLPLPSQIPDVSIHETQCDLQKKYDKIIGIKQKKECEVLNIHAFYDPKTNIIHLSEHAGFDTYLGVSIFLHEIVHYVQDMALESNDAGYSDFVEKYKDCPEKAFEWMAYKAELEYARQNRLDPWVAAELSPLFYIQNTTCVEVTPYE